MLEDEGGRVPAFDIYWNNKLKVRSGLQVVLVVFVDAHQLTCLSFCLPLFRCLCLR